MTFADLSPETVFLFGRKKSFDWKPGLGRVETYKPMEWIKTHDRGLSVMLGSLYIFQFDISRENGTNQYERTHGYRMFPFTRLFQYLNCAGTDYPGSGGIDLGFLSNFSPEELSFLRRQTATMNVPKGYNKKYGDTHTYSCLVNIPFLNQVSTFDQRGAFGLGRSYCNGWLVDADTLNQVASYGNIRRCNGSYGNRVNPVISIKEDAPVDRADDGKYIIRVPEPDFTGDLSGFFSWDAVAS